MLAISRRQPPCDRNTQSMSICGFFTTCPGLGQNWLIPHLLVTLRAKLAKYIKPCIVLTAELQDLTHI